MGNLSYRRTDNKTLLFLTRKSKFAKDAFDIPWIVDLSNSITKELQKNVEWIGISQLPPHRNMQGTKMLDYACGNGLASRVSY